MRIGLITSDLSTKNGWANYSLNLVRQLQARGISTTVVCAHNSPAVDFETHSLLPSVAPPERHSFVKSFRQLPRVGHLLRDCDIVHSTIEPYAILAAAVAGDRPLFVTAHGSYVNLPRMRGFPLGQLYRRAFARAQLICVSQHTAQVALAQNPGARVQVINNGLDAARFMKSPSLMVNKTRPTGCHSWRDQAAQGYAAIGRGDRGCARADTAGAMLDYGQSAAGQRLYGAGTAEDFRIAT